MNNPSIKTVCITFTDDNGIKYKVNLNQSAFISACKAKQVQYFIRMFEDFNESTKSEIEIHVPYADVMESIVEDIMNGEIKSSCTMETVKRIYCMNFFEMDITDEISKLADLDFNVESYDLLHQFIDQKGYCKQFIRLMVNKLPANYDCSKFHSKLLERMRAYSRSNLIIMRQYCGLIIFDLAKEIIIQKFSAPMGSRWSIESVIVNPTEPVVAIVWIFIDSNNNLENKLHLRDIFTGKKLLRIHTHRFAQSACFSSDGELLYVQHDNQIHVYCANTGTKIHLCYDISGTICDVRSSINYKLLSYIDGQMLCILDLSTGMIREICRDHSKDVKFVSDTTLIYIDKNNDEITSYDYITNKYHHVERISGICNWDSDVEPCVMKNIYIRDNKCVSIISDECNKYVEMCCFSHNGKYIYSFVQDSPKQLVRCCLDENGMVTSNRSWQINITNDIYAMANVIYEDNVLFAKKLNSDYSSTSY